MKYVFFALSFFFLISATAYLPSAPFFALLFYLGYRFDRKSPDHPRITLAICRGFIGVEIISVIAHYTESHAIGISGIICVVFLFIMFFLLKQSTKHKL